MRNNLIYLFIISYLFLFNVSRAQNADSTSKNQYDFKTAYVQTKSPSGAMLRSMILPGWGQFYNESYWKIPIVWGALGALAYAWKWNDDKVVYYDKLYHSEQASGYYNLREFYREQRDLNTVFFILVYALNVVDAYVDAHMFDFEISENKFVNSYEAKLNLKISL
jgi:hypothetical protein